MSRQAEGAREAGDLSRLPDCPCAVATHRLASLAAVGAAAAVLLMLLLAVVLLVLAVAVLLFISVSGDNTTAVEVEFPVE